MKAYFIDIVRVEDKRTIRSHEIGFGLEEAKELFVGEKTPDGCEKVLLERDPETDLIPVKSSIIYGLGYNVRAKTLLVQFLEKGAAGRVYTFKNVTAQQWDELLSADSIGSWFQKNIKPFKDKYPYKRIDLKHGDDSRAD